MSTVVTDEGDFKSILEILSKFKENDEVDIYSSRINPIEAAIVLNGLKISSLVIQKENNTLLFILNNGTILQRRLDEIDELGRATAEQLNKFENMGDGVIWTDIPSVDISLKSLIQQELIAKFKLEIV